MKQTLLFIVIIASILLHESCTKNNAPKPVANLTISPYAAVDKILNDSVPFSFGGKCYAIICVNGKMVYSKSYGGYKDSTVARVASCSKWLSGAVLMSLVDQGKLKLTDTVGLFLPVFSQYHKGNITIAQLFSHTSGFPGTSPQNYEQNPNITLAQCVDSIAKNVNLAAQPGQQFDYGNVSMQVAGRICEVVSGKRWQTLFNENIAIPTGMVASNYGFGLNPPIAVGAYSCARDYSRFLFMLMNNGISTTGLRVLSPDAVAAMEQGETNNTPIAYSPYPKSLLPLNNYYGVGSWRDITSAGDSLIEGSSPGAFGSHPWINRDKKITGIIFTYVPNSQGINGDGPTMPTCIQIRKMVRDIVQ